MGVILSNKSVSGPTDVIKLVFSLHKLAAMNYAIPFKISKMSFLLYSLRIHIFDQNTVQTAIL